MEFQQDCPEDKKITAVLISWLKTWKKFARLSFTDGAALEGSTIFFVAALWAVRQWKAVN